MKIINKFMQQYTVMNSDYETLREHAFKLLDSELKNAGIMAITSSRVKDPKRLREKLINRNKEETYQSIDDIVSDIPDFIGMRVALYFPNDREKVGTIIQTLFEVEKIKTFPQEQRSNANYSRRFPGYCATHYRVYLKNPPRTELGKQRIEIQVASLLMHAWSEVEHDLTYKQKKGKVSYDEYEVLDEINGIVLTGELSLQRLQRISEKRLASEKKKFESHYQLASFLYDKASALSPNSTIYLGDVETLFKLFKKKDRLTIKKVENDLQKIDWADGTPVAQQLIDIYADNSVDAAKWVISSRAEKSPFISDSEVNDLQIGVFLRKWIALEKKLVEIIEQRGGSAKRPGGIHRQIVESQILPEHIFSDYNRLRLMRNKIVHESEILNPSELEYYCDLIQSISEFLEWEYISREQTTET